MMGGATRIMMCVVVIVVVVIPSVIAVNLFSALKRGLVEEQEEIRFKPLRKESGYEVRYYPEKKWVCSEQGPDDNDQISVFLRLFAYIDGANDRKQKLVMGIPVSIEARGTGLNRRLQGCFFIPESVQSNPPKPTNSKVYITTRPAATVFTRKFGGFANDESTWDAETAKLKRILLKNEESFDYDLAFWNAYDSPIKLMFRRNEVWLVKA